MCEIEPMTMESEESVLYYASIQNGYWTQQNLVPNISKSCSEMLVAGYVIIIIYLLPDCLFGFFFLSRTRRSGQRNLFKGTKFQKSEK